MNEINKNVRIQERARNMDANGDDLNEPRD